MYKKIWITALLLAVMLPVTVEAASFLSRDARLIKQEGENKLYILAEGKRHYIRNLQVLSSYPRLPVETISISEFERTETARLIKSPLGPRVYLLDLRTNSKIWFPTEASFIGSGEDWDEIVEISGTDSLLFDNAQLLKTSSNPKVYEVNYSTLEKKHIASESEFVARGFDWDKIVTVPEALLSAYTEVNEFSTRDESTEPDDSTSETDDEVDQVAAQLTVSQTFMQPVLFVSGTSHNVVQRLKFTAGNGPASIQGLNLTRKGFLLDQDYDSVAVVDDVGFLLAEPKQPNRGVLNYTFVSPFRIEPNQTRIITVVASFKRTLTNSGQLPVAFSVEKEADIISNNQISGVFPITGQTHRIAPGGDLIGSLSVSPDPGYSAGRLVVGEKDVELNSFVFKETSGVEDISLYRIIVTLSGSLRVTDFSNFELVDERNRIIAKDPVVKGQQMAFVPTTPYLIERNDQQTFTVRADVVGGTDRVGIATIENVFDIRAVGQSFNYALTPISETGSFPIGRGGILEVDAGTVALALSKDTPTVGLPRGGSEVVLMRFEVKAGSQDLYWRRADLRINATSGALPLTGNVWLRIKGGDTYASVTASNLQNTTRSVGVSSPVLTANKSYVFELVANIANTLNVGDGYQIVLSRAEFDVVNGSDDIIFEQSLTSVQRAVQEVTLLVRKDTRFEPSLPVAGRTRFQVGRFLLKPSAGEDVIIKEIILEPTGGQAQFVPGFSNFNFEGSSISTPAGEKARFEFNNTIRTGSEAVYDLLVDTTSSVDGVTIGYEISSVKAVGKTSGAVVDVTLSEVSSPVLTFKKTAIEIESTAVTDSFIEGKAKLGAFTLTNNSLEEVDISAFTIVETTSSDGISVTDGYTNLRIERVSDGRTVTRTITSPVGGLGGDRLTSGPRLSAGAMETFYIVADAVDPTGDTIQLSITQIEGSGRTSRLKPFIEGVPIGLDSVNF